MKRVYIAGPITGVENYRVNFDRAADAVRSWGDIAVNPALIPEGMGGHGDYMDMCLPILRKCDAILLLPGWEDSLGAKDELMWALQHELEVYLWREDAVEGMESTMNAGREARILERAIETFGERAQIQVAIEEMSELTKALCKYVRSGNAEETKDAVLEEMADVNIMLDQLMLIFGDPTEWEIRKLERLEERLNKAEENK